MGGAEFPPCYLLVPNYGGGNEDNGNLQKIPRMYCYTHCPQPCSRSPPTHTSAGDSWTLSGQVWVSLLWGHCSFLLDPGAHKVLFVPSKSLFPQSCVSSGGSLLALMATLFKRAYAIPRSAAPTGRAPVGVHCWPIPPQEMVKHSSVSVSVGSLDPRVQKACLSLLSISGGNGVWF